MSGIAATGGRKNAIPIKNIYYMLAYALGLAKEDFDKPAAVCHEKFDHIHNLLAYLLEMHLSRQIKRGLHRAYVGHKEDLPALRGKIALADTIKSRLVRRPCLACEYDDLSVNNPVNRLLKTTALILLRHGEVDDDYKHRLKNDLWHFAGVETVAPATINWRGLCYPQHNLNYAYMLRLCHFILAGFLLSSQVGQTRLASYIDEKNLARLYEKFILEFYRAECPHIKANDDEINWAVDDGRRGRLPKMKTDITLASGGHTLIIDAKYYTRAMAEKWRGLGVSHRSDNLYQIFAYVKNMQANKGASHTVSGLLLYAKTDEAEPPDDAYRLSGNEIGVKTLDLNRDFTDIAAQLKAIAAEHFIEKPGATSG